MECNVEESPNTHSRNSIPTFIDEFKDFEVGSRVRVKFMDGELNGTIIERDGYQTFYVDFDNRGVHPVSFHPGFVELVQKSDKEATSCQK